jgi:hypothetical protein
MVMTWAESGSLFVRILLWRLCVFRDKISLFEVEGGQLWNEGFRTCLEAEGKGQVEWLSCFSCFLKYQCHIWEDWKEDIPLGLSLLGWIINDQKGLVCL